MQVVDLKRIDGCNVLVTSADDHHNPPVAMRGTLRVTQGEPAGLEDGKVEIVLDFPVLFTSKAHQRVITLMPAGITRLLASENNGAFAFEINEALDTAGVAVSPVARG